MYFAFIDWNPVENAGAYMTVTAKWTTKPINNGQRQSFEDFEKYADPNLPVKEVTSVVPLGYGLNLDFYGDFSGQFILPDTAYLNAKITDKLDFRIYLFKGSLGDYEGGIRALYMFKKGKVPIPRTRIIVDSKLQGDFQINPRGAFFGGRAVFETPKVEIPNVFFLKVPGQISLEFSGGMKIQLKFLKLLKIKN